MVYWGGYHWFVLPWDKNKAKKRNANKKQVRKTLNSGKRKVVKKKRRK